MKVEEIKVGTPVTYHQAIVSGRKLFPVKSFITSKPFTDEDGDIVCKIDGASGGVLITHLERRKIIVNCPVNQSINP